MAELFLAAVVGSYLLLLLFRRECIEFSGYLETTLSFFEEAIQEFAHWCAFIPQLLHYIIKFRAPESDAWQIAFALAIFHQIRTLPVELAIKKRVAPALFALTACAVLGASISYLFGIVVSESKPIITSLFIALLYGLLEFVRYTILAVTYRKDENHDIYREFKRRHLLYTLPYTLIGIISALTSWAVFGTSPAFLPVFAVILFSFVGLWILAVEVLDQINRALGRHSDDVPFLKSTRTQTVMVLITSCGLCLLQVYINDPSGLLNLAINCTVRVQ